MATMKVRVPEADTKNKVLGGPAVSGKLRVNV